MKEYTIRNKKIIVSISTFGAEPMSIRTADNMTEFLWQGDPAFWPRRAPIMFPVVGSCPNDTYVLDGKSFNMLVNGFAKISEFTVVDYNNERIILQLCSNDETRHSYPYDFCFTVEYSVLDNFLVVNHIVENLSDRGMPFAVGAHTGYKWPVFPDESSSDYSLIFELPEKLDALNAAGKTFPFLNDQISIALHHDMFNDGALYLTGLRSKWVELRSQKRKSVIRLYREEFPYLVLWSKPDEHASYLCIEPSLSIGFTETSLFDRKGIIILKSKDKYLCKYSVEFS